MSYFRFICLALAGVFFLFGCFQTETVIRLKPDGSGVIEETLMLSKDLLESFRELAKGFDDEADKTRSEAEKEKLDPIQGMIKEARARESQYGTGVKFISAIPLRTETIEENILFQFIKGPVSTLTVTMPKKKEEKKAPVQKKEPPDKGQADPDPKAMEQVKTFLKDMGIK